MQALLEAAREVPVRDEVDVLVVGGGSTRIIAATAAARTGAHTLVLESYGFLGGPVTGGPIGMHTFFNRYHDAQGTPSVPQSRKVQLIKGIPQELVDRLAEACGAAGLAALEGLLLRIGASADTLTGGSCV